MIYLLRASHANEFELQNYAPISDKLRIQVITSQSPLTSISLPSTKLWSPTDLPDLLLRRQLLNRLIGGEQWLLGLEKVIKSNATVHTAETYTPYTHQAVELRIAGEISKLICTCWETIPHANEKFARLRKWKQEAYKYVDIFHTPTERAKEALIKESVDPKKIVVIPYGVDLSRFKPVKHSHNHRPLILTVARLEKEKGMEDIESVAESLPQYDFLIIGRGAYAPTGANIRTSSVPYSEIHKVYQKADLFFFPSRTTPTWEEQYGMALIEAMACGLPVVTTDSGAIPEVVGDTGIILKEADVKEMSRTIFYLISNRDKLRNLSQRSLNHAKKFYDSRAVSAGLAKLYI